MEGGAFAAVGKYARASAQIRYLSLKDHPSPMRSLVISEDALFCTGCLYVDLVQD